MARDQSSEGTCASPVELGDVIRINDSKDEKDRK